MAVEFEVDQAEDYVNSRSKDWQKALDYFAGDLPAAPPAEETEQGFSAIVSTDVADAVEAVTAEIAPAFSGLSPVEFQPTGEEDEDQADLDTAAVTHVAANSGAYMAFSLAVKDALLRRMGIVKVYWEDRAQVSYEDYTDISVNMLPQLLQQQQNQHVEVVAGSVNEQAGTASGTIRRYTKRGKARLDPVPLDEFLVSANIATPNIEEVRFVAHRRPMPRTELVELGVPPDTAEALAAYVSITGSASAYRSRSYGDTKLETGHKSTEYVMVVEAYYRIDKDGDGIAELRRIITAGGDKGTDELLLDEPWDDQPFCVGVPYLGIYSIDGVSLYDKLKMVQDTKTDLLRELINATKRNMRQRVGLVEKDANPDDAMTSQMGGFVRCKTPSGVFALPDVQVPQAAYSTLEYMDGVRRDKGGGAIDTAAMAANIQQTGAHGLERVMSASEQINAMVAKNLCETMVKAVYRKLHRLLRKHQTDPIMFKRRAGWAQQNPQDWIPREDMVISMGMSVGERGKRVAMLQGVIANQQQDMQNGMDGILVGADQMYKARVDLARMGGLPNGEQYYIDPSSPEAQKAAQQKQQATEKQKLEAMQQQAMQFQANYRLLTDVERIRNEGKEQAKRIDQQIAEMRDSMNTMAKMFAERVKLVGIEADLDKADAQAEVDAMQARAKMGAVS